MTRSPLLRKSWRVSAKKSSAGELCCTPAARWTLVCSMPCVNRVQLSDRCIRCNRSAGSRYHRWKAEFLRLKGNGMPFEWRGRLRGRSGDRPCALREARKSCITRQRRWPPVSEEHTSELQSHLNLVCRLLLEKKKKEVLTS